MLSLDYPNKCHTRLHVLLNLKFFEKVSYQINPTSSKKNIFIMLRLLNNPSISFHRILLSFLFDFANPFPTFAALKIK